MLQILHLEDNPVDADLIERMVRKQGLVVHFARVQTRAEFTQAVLQTQFDVIVSDFEMPGFDGLSALKIARENAPGCPFLFVSGHVDERLAVEALSQGASGLIHKDRLERLPAAIRRVLGEVSARMAGSQGQETITRLSAYSPNNRQAEI